jgi:hypothetical protein
VYLRGMGDKEFIEKLIDINQPMIDNPMRYSTIGILLKGARNLSGRRLSDGVYEMLELNSKNFAEQTYYSGLFTGLINYLIFLEQLGRIYKIIKGEEISNHTNEIAFILTKFTGLNESEIFAIRALRNSLAHKYGLATQKENKVGLIHKFTISIESNKDVVKLPLVAWSGDFSDKNEQTNTTIYVVDLIDLIEKVYSNLKEEIKITHITLNVGIMDELKARFTITF